MSGQREKRRGRKRRRKKREEEKRRRERVFQWRAFRGRGKRFAGGKKEQIYFGRNRKIVRDREEKKRKESEKEKKLRERRRELRIYLQEGAINSPETNRRLMRKLL